MLTSFRSSSHFRYLSQSYYPFFIDFVLSYHFLITCIFFTIILIGFIILITPGARAPGPGGVGEGGGAPPGPGTRAKGVIRIIRIIKIIRIMKIIRIIRIIA